jgi:hypothetical protein
VLQNVVLQIVLKRGRQNAAPNLFFKQFAAQLFTWHFIGVEG